MAIAPKFGEAGYTGNIVAVDGLDASGKVYNPAGTPTTPNVVNPFRDTMLASQGYQYEPSPAGSEGQSWTAESAPISKTAVTTENKAPTQPTTPTSNIPTYTDYYDFKAKTGLQGQAATDAYNKIISAQKTQTEQLKTSNLTPEQRVTNLYKEVLGRTPDEQGMQLYAGNISKYGTTDQEIKTALLNSAEYKRLKMAQDTTEMAKAKEQAKPTTVQSFISDNLKNITIADMLKDVDQSKTSASVLLDSLALYEKGLLDENAKDIESSLAQRDLLAKAAYDSSFARWSNYGVGMQSILDSSKDDALEMNRLAAEEAKSDNEYTVAMMRDNNSRYEGYLKGKFAAAGMLDSGAGLMALGKYMTSADMNIAQVERQGEVAQRTYLAQGRQIMSDYAMNSMKLQSEYNSALDGITNNYIDKVTAIESDRLASNQKKTEMMIGVVNEAEKRQTEAKNTLWNKKMQVLDYSMKEAQFNHQVAQDILTQQNWNKTFKLQQDQFNFEKENIGTWEQTVDSGGNPIFLNSKTGQTRTYEEMASGTTNLANNLNSKNEGDYGGQCGRYVNDNLGVKGFMGDSYESKAARINSPTPVPGAVFVMKTGGKSAPYGHTGFVIGVNPNGTIKVKDSNWNNNEKVMVHNIPADQIDGYYISPDLMQYYQATYTLSTTAGKFYKPLEQAGKELAGGLVGEAITKFPTGEEVQQPTQTTETTTGTEPDWGKKYSKNVIDTINNYIAGRTSSFPTTGPAAPAYQAYLNEKSQWNELHKKVNLNPNSPVDSLYATVDPDIQKDVEAVMEGRNTLYNIRQTMGRTNKAAAYMQRMRDSIATLDPNFDFIASDAGAKFISSSFYQRAYTAITSVEPNIDEVVKLSNEVGRIGITGVDKLIQDVGLVFNDKKIANFHEAQKLIADEIGLALGQGSVSDMKLQLGYDITDPNMSAEVFASNMGEVKKFIENRKKALNDMRYSSSVVNGSNTSTNINSNSSNTIRVKQNSTGLTGTIPESEFNDKEYTKIQ